MPARCCVVTALRVATDECAPCALWRVQSVRAMLRAHARDARSCACHARAPRASRRTCVAPLRAMPLPCCYACAAYASLRYARVMRVYVRGARLPLCVRPRKIAQAVALLRRATCARFTARYVDFTSARARGVEVVDLERRWRYAPGGERSLPCQLICSCSSARRLCRARYARCRRQ